jgi:hypothetical protein
MNITRMHCLAAFSAAALVTFAMLMGVDTLASAPALETPLAPWAGALG